MPNKLDEAWGVAPAKTSALDSAWGDEKPAGVPVAASPNPAPHDVVAQPNVPVVPATPEAPPDRIDLNASQPSRHDVRVLDERFGPTSHIGQDVWKEQAIASLGEDWRRTKEFVGTTVPDALHAAWDAQGQAGDFLANNPTWEIPKQFSDPHTQPDSVAYQLDAYLNRSPLEQLQVIGHGIAPDTVPAPGPAPVPTDRPIEIASALKDAAFSPVVSSIHYAQHGVGKPVVDAVLNPLESDPRVTNSTIGSASLLAARQAGQFIGGEEAGPNPDAPYSRNAGDATVPAMMLGEVARQAPFFLLNTGMGARAIASDKAAVFANDSLTPLMKAKALAPLLKTEAAVEGLAQGSIQTALTPGSDIITGPAVASVLGVLSGQALAARQAKSGVLSKYLPMMSRNSWESFTQYINETMDNAAVADARGQRAIARTATKAKASRMAAAGLEGRIQTVVVDGEPVARVQVLGANRFDDAHPALYTTVVRDAQGNLVGRRVQGRVMGEDPATANVNLSYQDTVINTDAQKAAWWKKVGSKGGLTRAANTPAARADYAEVMDSIYPPNYDTPREEVLPNGQTILVHDESVPIRGGGQAAPEEAVRHPMWDQYKSYSVAVRDANAKRAAVANERSARPSDATPVVVRTDKNGALEPTYINPGNAFKPDNWKPVVGDIVELPAVAKHATDPDALHVVYKVTDEGVWIRPPGSKSRGKVYRTIDLNYVTDKEALPMLLLHKRTIPGRTMDPVLRDHLLSYETLTVPRIMAEADVGAGDAVHILRWLEEGKYVQDEGMGYYRVRGTEGPAPQPTYAWGTKPRGPVGPPKPPANPVPPGMRIPIQNGLEVWYGQSSSGRPLKGVIRGPDPQNAGHYLIDVVHSGTVEKLEAADALQSKTLPGGTIVKGVGPQYIETRSVPQDVIRTTVPVNMAQPSLQKMYDIKGLYGMTVPHPPNFVVASSTFRQQVNDAVSIAQKAAMPGPVGRKLAALEGQLLNAYYLTPRPLRHLATPLYAAWPYARESMLRISERVKDATGGYGTLSDQQLIDAVEAPHLTGQSIHELRKWLSNNPDAVASMRTLKDLLNERKQLSQWMGQRGFSSIDWKEQLRDSGEDAEHLTMMYNVDVLKGKYDQWVKQNVPQLWDNAMTELTRGGRNAAEVSDELSEVMRQKDPESAFAKSSLVDGAAFAKLKARGQWQKQYPAIAKLMGPVPSAALRLGHTIGYQRAIKIQVEAWDSIAASQWASPGPREDLMDINGAYTRVPMNPRFGNAKGLYVHPSLKNFINTPVQEQTGSIVRMLGWAGGKWKSFNTVYGGPAPWVNNMLRNLKGVALSGAWTGREDWEGFRDAPGLLLAWRENPSMLGPANIVGEARSFGAVSGGMAAAEISDARRRIQDDLLRAMTRAAGKSNRMEDMVMAAQDHMRKGSENIKDAYDAIDQYFKLATYINLRRRNLRAGMSQHDAAATATEIIRSSYPDFELVGPAVQQMRSKAGWFAPFLSSKAEDLRINAMAAARVARTVAPPANTMVPVATEGVPFLGGAVTPPNTIREPDLILRLIAFTAAVGGAAGTMRALARANGITSQHEEAAVSSLPLKQQAWRPLLVPMWDLDDRGRVQFIDLTPVDDLGMMLRGNATDPVYGRLFVNNLTDVVGDETLPGRMVQHWGQESGMVSRGPQDMQPIPYGEAGVLGLLGDYARNGGVPQAPLRMYDAYQKGQPQPMNPAAEPWTGGQVAAKMMGLPMAGPSGIGSMTGTLKEAKGNIKQLKNEAKQLPKRLGESSGPRFDYLLQSKVRGLGAVQQHVSNVRVPPTLSQPGTLPAKKEGK